MKQFIGISRDHSGSMYNIAKTAMNDYNAQLETIKNASSQFNIDTYITTVTCGGSVNYENLSKPIALVHPLTAYYAAGGTPLFDSVMRVIDALKAHDNGDPDVSFLVQVITDGEENISKTSGHTLAQKINQLQETDRWTFTFRVPTGYKRNLMRLLNIPEGNIIEWDGSSRGMEVATAATTQAYNQYYTARSTGVKSTRGFYADLSNLKSSDVKKNLTDITQELNIYSVDKEDEAINKFVERKTNTPLVKGTVFYELTKYERAIQDHKMIVLQDLKQGGFYSGSAARKMLGLPDYGSVSISPGDHAHYKIFVQSTSLNRKLKKGTSVLHWPTVR
jgi:hypothetical protein